MVHGIQEDPLTSSVVYPLLVTQTLSPSSYLCFKLNFLLNFCLFQLMSLQYVYDPVILQVLITAFSLTIFRI